VRGALGPGDIAAVKHPEQPQIPACHRLDRGTRLQAALSRDDVPKATLHGGVKTDHTHLDVARQLLARGGEPFERFVPPQPFVVF